MLVFQHAVPKGVDNGPEGVHREEGDGVGEVRMTKNIKTSGTKVKKGIDHGGGNGGRNIAIQRNKKVETSIRVV